MASTLMNIITTAQGELGKLGNASGATNAKTKAKKPSARKGRPTPHGDFTKKILEEHKAAVKTFKAELKESNPDQKGAHLIFVSNYKKAHMDEYNAFEAAWNETHPKDDSASEAASVAEGSDAEANATAKPKRVISDEQKAKMKAGREKKAAEKKALKAAEEQAATTEVPATPATITPVIVAEAPAKKKGKQVVVATPVTPVTPVVAAVAAPVPFVAETTVAETTVAEEENEFIPFKHSATNYLRLGIKREDGNHLWASGDLWASKKGQKGAYIGCLQADGTIDKTAEEPMME